MILVDSSVWVDYFRGVATPQTNRLDELLATEPIVIGDLIFAEVLQGFTDDRSFAIAKNHLNALIVLDLGGREIALKAANNFRHLRKYGRTVRKTIDTIIATRCIESDIELLHSDRDFDAFAEHLGLQVVI